MAGEDNGEGEEAAQGRRSLCSAAPQLQGEVADIRYSRERSTGNEKLGKGRSPAAVELNGVFCDGGWRSRARAAQTRAKAP
jgi:hypothetical protein